MKFWIRGKRKAGIILLCLSASGALILLAGKEPYRFSADAQNGRYQIEESSASGKLGQKTEEENFRIQINASPEADYITGRCGLMLGNPKENERDVQVQLVLDETGESIFLSEVIEPGSRLAYVTLDLVPEPGDYAVTAMFQLLDEEDKIVVGEIAAGLVLSVRK